jgi:hypothetical protein
MEEVMHGRHLGRVVALSLLVLSVTRPARADIFFSQPVSQPSGTADGFFSTFGSPTFGAGPQQEADNFTILPPTALAGAAAVTSAHWWGSYFTTDGQPQGNVDNFTLRFFSDAGGNPATNPFFQVNPAVTRVDTGEVDAFGDEIFYYSADFAAVNVPLNTTLYFSVVDGVTAPDFVWNAQDTTDVPGHDHWTRGMDIDPWVESAFAENMAFQLDGFFIPEPSTLAVLSLSSLGLVGAWVRRRRRRAVGH